MDMSIILGHRGASGYAPENTLEAFRLAMDMGADGFELDVHLSRQEHWSGLPFPSPMCESEK